MTLSAILDDIAGDSAPVVELPTDLPEPTGALEHLSGLPVLVERARQLSAHQHTHRVVSSVLSAKTVSKATALEVFTMLPGEDADSMLLTEATTEHNHRLVLKASAGLFSQPNEARSLIADVQVLVHETLSTTEELLVVAGKYLSALDGHLVRLSSKPPIVILGNKSINLLTTAISTVSRIDSFSLSYPPYEGVLDAKFRAIEEDPQFGVLPDTRTPLVEGSPGLTLGNSAVYLRDQAKTMIELVSELRMFKEDLNTHITSEGEVKVADIQLSVVLDRLTQIKTNASLFLGPQCLAARVLDCLSTLV